MARRTIPATALLLLALAPPVACQVTWRPAAKAFDGDYRVLRSRGLIERTVINRLSELLGVEPIEQ